jgi:nitrogen PTS system EIIA component
MNKVSDYLSDKKIAFYTAGPSKRQVLGGLLGMLDLPDSTVALKAILAREEMGSTIIAPGLALPHARIEGLEKLQAAVGVCPTGVSDPHAGGTLIRVFVLFLGPADKMTEHLAFLAGVSALFQRKGFIDELCKLATPQGILAAIKKAEK